MNKHQDVIALDYHTSLEELLLSVDTKPKLFVNLTKTK